jgi:transposase
MTPTEEKWKERVADWRASGLTAEEYCTGKSFKAGGLRWWSSRLNRIKPDRIRIARVVRTSEAAPKVDTAIVIELGAVRLAVRRGVDQETLRVVLGAIGAGR